MNIAPISEAQLPRTYQAAKNALAECVAFDECKDWADKAAAMTAYGKQANDLELEKMAIRIRDRAIRRIAELSRQMMRPHGTNRFADRDNASVNSTPREEVRQLTGLTTRQFNNALAIGKIPEAEFEALVESADPPSVNRLAQIGAKHHERPDPETWLKGRTPEQFNRTMSLTGDITDYADLISRVDLDQVLPFLDDKERADLRQAIARIDAIHDQIATRI